MHCCILLAGMATTFTMAAANLDGTWVGIMVLDNQAGRISLTLHEEGQSVSGTATFGDDEPAKIKHPESAGNVLRFAVYGASGDAIKFRLKVVDGLLVGEVFHRGEALAGEAKFGDRIAEVMLPFHNGCTTPALLLQSVPAEYSHEARRAQLEGTVYLSVLIDTGGQPVEIHVMRGLGMGLDQKAAEALKKWQFKPALLKGKPVPFETIVAVHFRYF
jgi:TonB family protein